MLLKYFSLHLAYVHFLQINNTKRSGKQQKYFIPSLNRELIVKSD